MYPNHPPPHQFNRPPNMQWAQPMVENRFRSNFFPNSSIPHQPRPPQHQRNNFQNKSIELLREAEAIREDLKQQRISKDIHLQDELWVSNWTRNLELLPPAIPTENETLTISEYRNMLTDALENLQELKGYQMKIEHSQTVDQDLARKGAECKKRLEYLQNILTKETLRDHIKSQLRGRQSKRIRIKKRKEEKKQERINEELYKKRKEIKIDKWISSFSEKELERKRDDDLRKTADDTLRDVRKKIADSKRTQLLLAKLEELKKIRERKEIEKRLQVFDSSFDSNLKCLQEIINEKLGEYNNEQNMLQVMLNEKAGDRNYQKNLRLWLFGRETDEFWYHAEGKKSVERLVEIRQKWDRYLCDKDKMKNGEEDTDDSDDAANDFGGCIPLYWVRPPIKPSDEWSKYATQRDFL
ncbi:DgyrCDS5417 [Dimorphilus gyrociliatus]|uniref:DgyrCDS5417 n=1 Tax=Dimorphilus gyrociliatus TaxID=2664684 RepID=A0A7I8VJU5_9ANNE|nr:DgyrCDS5417 [Dimorphilus gyrociliatus]